MEAEDRNESRNGDQHHDVVLKRPLADPHDRLQDDRENGSLQPEEQSLHDPDIAKLDVDIAQRQYRQKSGKNEQGT